jgi:hypothetical protein
MKEGRPMSLCQKVLVAFFENGAEFEPYLVDFGNEPYFKFVPS